MGALCLLEGFWDFQELTLPSQGQHWGERAGVSSAWQVFKSGRRFQGIVKGCCDRQLSSFLSSSPSQGNSCSEGQHRAHEL